MTGFLRRNGAALAVLCVGGAMLGLGLARGEALTVLQKATLICLECIGIG